MTAGGPHQEPPGQPSPGQPAQPRSGGVGLGRRKPADYAVAAGALLYLVCALVPWFAIDGIDFGGGLSSPGFAINGFDFGLVTLAFVLLLVAAVWAVLTALTDVPVPFPPAAVTAGLAALAFLLTVIEWLRVFDLGFSVMALLTVLAAAATLGFALVRLLSQLPRADLAGRAGPRTAVRAAAVRAAAVRAAAVRVRPTAQLIHDRT